MAPVITDETLGFDAHQAIASWDKGTPSSSAIGFSPITFLSTSSINDLLARFCNAHDTSQQIQHTNKVLAAFHKLPNVGPRSSNFSTEPIKMNKKLSNTK